MLLVILGIPFNNGQHDLFDIILKAQLLPLPQKLKFLHFHQNALNKLILLPLKSNLLLTTITLRRCTSHQFLTQQQFIFHHLLYSYPLLRVYGEDLEEDLS